MASIAKWGVDFFWFQLNGLPGMVAWSYILSPPWLGLLHLEKWHSLGALIGLVSTAFIFMALGLAMSVKRLRTIGWNSIWCLVFFIPLFNLLFFLLLLAPPDVDENGKVASRTGDIQERSWQADSRKKGFWGSPWITVVAAVVVPAGAGFLLAALALKGLKSYGMPLFLGLPFGIGMATSALTGSVDRFAIPKALLALCLFGSLLLLLTWEGLVCIVMCAPIAALFTCLGVYVQRGLRKETGHRTSHALASLALGLPLSLVADAGYGNLPVTHRVATERVVAAPPETIWRHVVTFSELPPPTHWIFRYGLAYPLRARIDGEGVGALRHCEFSTGSFEEPITVWNPPHHLAFDVTQSPAPMRESNPFGEVAAPHLHGYFASKHGEFRLEALPHGHTRVTGTTWYVHGLRPEGYWSLWGDFIIHRIHREVLNHVAALSESAPKLP